MSRFMCGKRKERGPSSEPLEENTMKKGRRSSNDDHYEVSLSESSSCSSLNSIRAISQEDIRGNLCSDFLANDNDGNSTWRKDKNDNYRNKSCDAFSFTPNKKTPSKNNISLVDYSDNSDDEELRAQEISSKKLPPRHWTAGSVYAQLNFSRLPKSWLDGSFESTASSSSLENVSTDAVPKGKKAIDFTPLGSSDSLADSTCSDSTFSQSSSSGLHCSIPCLVPDVFRTPDVLRKSRPRLRRWSSSGSIEKSSMGVDLKGNRRLSSPVSHFYRSTLPFYHADKLMTLNPGIGVIDTHCHLDFLFRRLNYLETYEKYQEENSSTFPVCYEGCVAVFCDPATFEQKTMWKKFLEIDGVWAAFGCHPHMAHGYNEISEFYLKESLNHEKVVALGEIGLDYSPKNNCDRDVQKTAFKRQLEIAIDFELPLVIHARDSDEDCIEIMKELVPVNYRIHRHCYTGNWESAQLWLNTFPNLYLGITALVTFPSAKEVHEVVTKIPLTRLLLETDAPYFVPKPVQGVTKWSHPGMVIHVAAQIAAIKKSVTINDVLKAARENTRFVYGI